MNEIICELNKNQSSIKYSGVRLTVGVLTDAGKNGTFWPVYFALGAEENVDNIISVEMRRSK